MALNIGGTGIAKPYCKYNAKADKWFVRGADGEDAEIARPTFVIDLDNIATGWLLFREGQAPERLMDPSLDQPAPSPGEGFKRGFVVATFSPKFFGGVAEFASATGSEAMKDRYGTNYRPTFQIVQWVDRPKELPNQSPVDAADIWRGNGATPATAKAPAQHVPPPAPKPAADPLNEPVF